MAARRRAERSRSGAVACLAGALILGSCASPTPADVTAGPDPGATGPASTTVGGAGTATAGTAEPVEGRRLRVDLPPVPPIALPDISILGDTGDLVADRLGDLIAPVNGVDLVAAGCFEDGGELVYTGSTGSDLFAIERDGSGRYVEQSEDGLITLEVDADGSGRYYDASGSGLTTIDVRPDGSGRYYRREPGGLVTVVAAADGSGEYYDDRRGLLTVTIAPDGSGQYYSQTDEGLLTIDAGSDGSGEYYRRNGDAVTTIDVDGDGGWVLSASTPSQRLVLTVAADGTGRYVRTSLDPIDFDFDPEGRATDGSGWSVVVPPAPELGVADRFPSLGKLGSLAPPCAAVIRFDASLLFEFDEATLRPEAATTLDRVAAALAETDRAVEIHGHTDSRGSEEYNLDLSRRRADAVEVALRERGLAVDMSVTGYGESRPVAPNETEDGGDDPAGRALNRRVEIVIPE